ncbi:hypothetical protein BJ508DRAFT_1603 [Ascobolus immersus RN42]|uniref:Uncharacterized protein n=1 Tax=Ascobolus immersus RN42 TaxID=1160509 RepID=A0A3N4IPA5_ASCIM|nr:hypothetical protein BJ508DRAFT_1603 [Ascobolus immersus RN42]
MNESRPKSRPSSSTLPAHSSALIAAFNWRPPVKQSGRGSDSNNSEDNTSSTIATDASPERSRDNNKAAATSSRRNNLSLLPPTSSSSPRHYREETPYSGITTRPCTPPSPSTAPEFTITAATNSDKSSDKTNNNNNIDKDMQFIYPDPETDDRAGMSASLTLERERQLEHTVRRLSMSRIHLSPGRTVRERDPRSLSPMLERDSHLLTPPSSQHNTMTSTETAPYNDGWDEDQSVGADTMPSSTLSFEVLSNSKFERIPAEERIRQHQQTAVPPFRPNSELPFPVSSNLFRRYYPGDRERERTTKPDEFRAAMAGNRNNMGVSTRNSYPGDGMRRSASVLEVGSKSELDYYPDEEGAASNLASSTGCLPHHTHTHHPRHMSASVSSSVDDTSGIPSYSQEFGHHAPNARWRFEPLPDQSVEKGSANDSPTGSITQRLQASRKVDDSSLASAYAHEISSQFEQLLRWAKRPLCFALLVAVLGFFINSLVTGIMVPMICTNPAFASSFPCLLGSVGNTQGNNTYYADFPTLMNIESSFEKIVDGAAGGTALARVMKQSEMAVSDLSTVVKYSELKCRDTLSTKLDNFAQDAKGSVRALSGWGSKVGGVLDQLLSINQYALRELHSLRHQPRPLLSLLSPSPPLDSPQTQLAISSTFNKAAEVLEHSLRILVTDGETIFTSLTRLTEQHKPIYDEIVREVVDIKKEEEVVLSSLWTKMGGNQGARKNFRDNAKLLGLIGKYEEEARGYVESTMIELDRMMADLENLRRRVAEPLLVGGAVAAAAGSRGQIPLGVHIDAIEKAVERLVRKRGERREREDGYLRRIVEREGAGGESILLEQ